ncbi:MAG TPA: hypothetical protein VNQ99_08680 [Xanthobacteraceae bacterium]|nr:hypothetical protein [Xanthobacteraceae bacterium]
MADYYPLIARAVAGIEKNTAEDRRALYERARTALVGQLRSVTPALSEAEITRERLALEDAIRRVEADMVKQSRGNGAPAVSSPPSAPAPPASPPINKTRIDPRIAAGGVPADSGKLPPEAGRPQAPAVSPPAVPPRAAPSPARPSLADSAVSRFRSQARSGDAPATGEPREPRERPAGAPQDGAERPVPRDPRDPSAREGARNGLRGSVPAGPEPDLSEPRLSEPQSSEARSPAADRSAAPAALAPDTAFKPAPPRPAGPSAAAAAFDPERISPAGLPPEPPEADEDDDFDADERPPRRSYAGLIRALVVLLLLGGAAGAVYWKWTDIQSFVQSARAPSAPKAPPRDPATTTQPKITDRLGVGPNATQPPADAQVAAVAQRVVLYEEDPSDPQGKSYPGVVTWRTETVTGGPGQPPDVVVKADIQVPERNLAMTWSFRRNTDQALPASHTIEVMFKLPQDAPNGGIGNVPGVLMKQAEQARGIPLAGVAVKVTNGYFLIALYSVEAERERNIQLLKERAWFDIPIVYGNNRRAILAMEKGTPGEKAFNEAFAAWGE